MVERVLRSLARILGLAGCGLLFASPMCVTGCGRTTASDVAESAPLPEKTERSERGAAFPISREGAHLVGTPAPPFASDLEWLNTEPLTVENLRGKVVLVRFWTDTCPFCEASAPGLSRLHERYGSEGLVVVGMFHPKPRGSLRDMGAIAARAETLGMDFPIASDNHWDTLERWWLSTGEHAATSVSFLIDGQGTIRWIHPGPEFHPEGPPDHERCRRDYADAVRAIESLLAERDRPVRKVG